jgi:biotin-(acetyl-CoA carboxylase) ligase
MKLFGINENLSFETPDKKVFDGKMTGVSKLGKLKIELPDLEVKEFDIKEVKFLI